MYSLIKNRIADFVVAGVFLLAVVYIFSGIIFYPGKIPGYRDASQFYYPLFLYLQDCFHSGEIPLWTPYFNLGFPLVANATTALFYPPCWILALPIPPWLAFNVYIIGHVIFAGGSMYFCLRKWNRTTSGCVIAAISYALGGIVLFQYSNLIYLVSASWLPLGLYAIDSVLKKPTLKRILFTGAILAFMTLGGDVQTAYNLGIAALLAALIRFYIICKKSYDRKSFSIVSFSQSRLLNKAVKYVGILAVVGIVGFVLAALQIIPSLELAGLSDRFSNDNSVGTAEIKYNYSIPPWRLAEFIIPEFSGRQFPIYSRWTDIIPGNDTAAWVASLYMGTIPFLLACFALRFQNVSSRRVWISWLVIIALAASMGRMSIGYLLQTVGFWTDSEYFRANISSGWGGVYWLISVIFPGYDAFRYPGKWLTVAAAGISILSAFGWDALWKRPQFKRCFVITCLCTAGFMLLWTCIVWSVIPRFTTSLSSSLYGPYTSYFPTSLLFSTTGLLLISGLILFSKKQNRARIQALIVLIVVADVAFYSARLVAPVPSWIWEKDDINISSYNRTGKVGNSWLPPSFKNSSSLHRETELARWNYVSLFGYNSLYRHAPDMRYGGTVMINDYARFLQQGRSRGVAAELPLCSHVAKNEGGIVVFTANKNCWQDGKLIPTPHGEISGEKLIEHALKSSISSRVVERSSNRYLLKIQTEKAGTLAIPQQYYPGWKARISRIETDKHGKPLPSAEPGKARFYKESLYKIGGVFQAVDIPTPGTWTIELTYRPTSLLIGLIVSSLGWIFAIVGQNFCLLFFKLNH